MANLRVGKAQVFDESQSWHYFPLSLPNLANVTTLDITLKPTQIDFTDVLKDLSRMRVLDDFTLKLDSCSWNGRPNAIPQYEKTELTSVRRLRIDTECDFASGSESLLKKSLFSSLFFPGVVDLRVRFSGEVSKGLPPRTTMPPSI